MYFEGQIVLSRISQEICGTFGNVKALSIQCPEAFGPTDENSMIDLFLTMQE